MDLFELTFLWTVSAVVLALPTGLVVAWALCRTPSWNQIIAETPQADEATNDAPRQIVAEAA